MDTYDDSRDELLDDDVFARKLSLPSVPPKNTLDDARKACDIVPQGQATEGVFDLFTHFNTLAQSGEDRIILPDGATVEFVKDDNGLFARFSRETENNIAIAEIDDVEIFRRTSSTTTQKRVLLYILTAVRRVIGADGRPTTEFLEFPLQDVVDIGMYKSEQSAYTGFVMGLRAIEHIRISAVVKHRRDLPDYTRVQFFGNTRIIGKRVIVQLNMKADWRLITQFFMVLPRYFHEFRREHTQDFFRYVCVCARMNQNIKLLRDGKPFYISLAKIHMKLGLPIVGSSNATRDIIATLNIARDEVENKHYERWHNSDLQLELVDKKDRPLVSKDDALTMDEDELPTDDNGNPINGYNTRNYIGEGRLKVIIKGGLLEHLLEVSGMEKKHRKPRPSVKNAVPTQAVVSDATPYSQPKQQNDAQQ